MSTTSLRTQPGQSTQFTVVSSKDTTDTTVSVEFSYSTKFSNIALTKTPVASGKRVTIALTTAEVDTLKDAYFRVKADGLVVAGGSLDYIPKKADSSVTPATIEANLPPRLSDESLKAVFGVTQRGPWADLVRAAQFGYSHTAAIGGDSTSDNFSSSYEWPLLSLKLLSVQYPNIRMEHYAYDDATSTYGAANVVNAGAAATGGVIAQDTFSVDGNAVGAAADTKGTWVGNTTVTKASGRATFSANGALSVTTPTQDSTVSTNVLINTAGLSGFHAFRFGNAFSNASLTGYGVWANLSLNGPWVTYLQLFKTTAAGASIPLTTSETLPDLGLWNVSNKAVNITTTLSGNTFTFTMTVAGGQTITRTGTVTTQERSEIGFFAGASNNPGNGSSGLAVDDITISTPVIATPTIKIYNGSVAGKNLDYMQARLPSMLPVPMDSVFLSYGHNQHLRPGGPEVFVSDYKKTLDMIKEAHPNARLYLGSQNPEFSPRDASLVSLHATRQSLIADVAREYGCTYVPVYEAFANSAVDNGRALVQADGVHPNNPPTFAATAGYGSTLWAKTVTGL